MKGTLITISLVLAGVLAFHPTTLATLGDAWVVPEAPTTLDPVVLYVDGYLNDSCWSLETTDFDVQGGNIEVSIDLFDSWQPGMNCLMMITEYEETFDLGYLAAGTYTVAITEYHDSLRSPDPQTTSLTFTVTDGGQCFLSTVLGD